MNKREFERQRQEKITDLFQKTIDAYDACMAIPDANVRKTTLAMMMQPAHVSQTIAVLCDRIMKLEARVAQMEQIRE